MKNNAIAYLNKANAILLEAEVHEVAEKQSKENPGLSSLTIREAQKYL